MSCSVTPTVLADPSELHQVTMNLCTNAWHALEGKPGRVVVGLEAVTLQADSAKRPGGLAPGDYAHLLASDNGCGMDEATQQRIFEPFFTTKPVGRGTGLGLSVVHGIVAAHRGAIAVDSQPGHGSTFHIYLPLAEPDGDALAAFVWGALEPLQDQSQGRHVLYIDDDEVMLLLAQRLLLRQGYRVTCSQNPDEAIAMVRHEPYAFDLVVSDFDMPQCSGLDVASALACIRADLPVVISSGYITPEMRADAQTVGIRGLINKENTLEELGSLVQLALRSAWQRVLNAVSRIAGPTSRRAPGLRHRDQGHAATECASRLTFRRSRMAWKLTARLSMLGMPVGERMRCRLLLGLAVNVARCSKPIVALIRSRSSTRAISGSRLRNWVAASSRSACANAGRARCARPRHRNVTAIGH